MTTRCSLPCSAVVSPGGLTRRAATSGGYIRAVDVASLGFRTDLMLRRLAGASVIDRGDHLVVRTDANPTFYWGNFLLLAEPPADGGARWLDTFAREFPDAQHIALGIDGTAGRTGDITALVAAGLDVELNVVLTAPHLSPPRARADIEVRRLVSDDDWEQAVALRLAVDENTDGAHETFVRRKAAESRRLVDTGHGAYFGAVIAGRVRASLGIVTDGSGIARYQNVETHPDHRRRGLASALLTTAAAVARAELDASTLVIAADPDYVAVDLYRSLGFSDGERQVQLERAPTRTPRRPAEDAAAGPEPAT
jgi:ribosomal protein S18 acetylase RimI-like enzyme